MADLKPFFLVMRDDDGRLKRHLTRREAEAEAKRLADQHPENAFVVLQTNSVAGPIRPRPHLREFVPQDGYDGIPF